MIPNKKIQRLPQVPRLSLLQCPMRDGRAGLSFLEEDMKNNSELFLSRQRENLLPVKLFEWTSRFTMYATETVVMKEGRTYLQNFFTLKLFTLSKMYTFRNERSGQKHSGFLVTKQG